ncbi:alpha/beta-hydrolase [Ramaria rubella]|nr:alpha/beta-hydrolase [Ramaria rubella]
MSAIPQEAPYGTWKSPITAEILTQASVGLDGIVIDDVANDAYYIERRPSEGGRSVLVNFKDHADVVGKEFNVRTSVHEYGGLAATACCGVVYFSNFKDSRVYRTEIGKTPEPVTPENENWRYAELTVVKAKATLLIAVLEDHTKPEPVNVVNKLVVIDVVSQAVKTLVEGADFYSFPVISPNGKKLAWLQWHHPDMPWEGSELMLADLIVSETSCKVENAKKISGERGEISISQPQWASDDTLVFLNDSSGFVNPWSHSLASLSTGPIFSEPIVEDFAEPAWFLGKSDYAVLNPEIILFVSTRNGRSVLSIANLRLRSLKDLSTSYAVIVHLRRISSNKAIFLCRKDDETDKAVQVTLPDVDGGEPTFEITKSIASAILPCDIISTSRSYALSPSLSNDPIHVLYYPPFNPHYISPPREAPPAVVAIHGGPTSRTPPGLDWSKQFWTTRGWAWVDVNYGGSSGYGRKYRERLRGNWGIVDVNDAVEAVSQLGAQGLIDPKRTAIRGGSAGGYTVLATLVNKPKVFAAGTSLYGVSDLARLAEDTHKFESRYLEKLVGGTPEQIPEVYKARSPITHADQIESPLLILQGSIDKVVPPSQAEAIVESVKKKGGRVRYIVFEGEGHGWRKAENIKRGLELEQAWYQEVFGLSESVDAAL